MPVPPEAIEAANRVIDEQHCCGGHATQKDAELVARALLAANEEVVRISNEADCGQDAVEWNEEFCATGGWCKKHANSLCDSLNAGIAYAIRTKKEQIARAERAEAELAALRASLAKAVAHIKMSRDWYAKELESPSGDLIAPDLEILGLQEGCDLSLESLRSHGCVP